MSKKIYEFYLNPIRVKLLQNIKKHGSLSKASKMTGVCYKTAWDYVDTINNQSSHPLVEKVVGGISGGGARLSEYGEKVLENYLKKNVGQKIVQDSKSSHAVVISTPNQFLSVVSSIKKGSVHDEIKVNIDEDILFVVIIPSIYTHDLKLKPGKKVNLFFNSTSLLISTKAYDCSARNQLKGIVQRIKRGKVAAMIYVNVKNRVICVTTSLIELDELNISENSKVILYLKSTDVLLAGVI